MRDGGAELIERDVELRLIEAALTAAIAGSGNGLLIRSPAGMGKTALLEAGKAMARQRGMRVLSARGGLLEHEFAFGVVRQLLFAVGLDPALSARALDGAGIGASSMLNDDGPAPAIPDGTFGLAYSIFWALVNIAGDGPLCLIVDDLHWADGPSIRVLDFVLRRVQDAPIAIIAALRSGEHPPGDALAVLPELEVEGLLQVVGPAPLSVRAVAELASRTFGPDVEPEFADACHDRTAGNPFFVTELLRELHSRGASPSAAMRSQVAASVPERAGRIVLARLKRLGHDSIELARAVAILADHATLTDAAELALLPRRRAAAAAERLTVAGLLKGEDGLVFVHPLMRDAVESDMPREVISYWHARAADVLATHGRDPQVVAAHLMLTPASSSERTVGRLQVAARIAHNRAAPDAAITILRRALAEPPAEHQLRDVLFDLGSAESAVGDAEAIGHLEAARDRGIGATERAEVALVLARTFMLSGQPQGVYSAVAQARRELGDGSHELVLALQAIALLTGCMDAAGPPPTLPGERAQLSILAGETLAERAVLACVAFDSVRMGAPIGETNRLIGRIMDRGGVAAADGADPFTALSLITAIQWCGRLDQAVALTDDLIDYARSVNSGMVFAEALGSRAMTRWRAGALDQAEADARQSLEIEGALRRGRSPVAIAALSRVLVDQGHAGEALELLRASTAPGLPLDHVIREIGLTSLGRVQIALRRYDDALVTLLDGGRIAESVGTVNPVASEWRVQAAATLNALGRVSEARAMVGPALEHSRRAGGAAELGSTLRVAAQLDDKAALELLRESHDVLRDSGMSLELAYTQAALGARLRVHGDAHAAREPLELAMDVAQRCGAAPLAAAARAELIAAGGRPRRWERSGVNSLTPSERRVVELAAAGNTNRQIAQHLFVSTRTAESHLRNAFRKLGVSSRSELAAALATRR